MTTLDVKRYVVQMLAEGFALAPCANPDCENLFASDTYCVTCEQEIQL